MVMRMKVLVTGGLGYIGSHTVVELVESGHEVVIIDDLSNSSRRVLSQIRKITGSLPKLYIADLCELEATKEIFANHGIDVVIHFAGLKSLAESTKDPLLYYRTNIVSTLNLLECMSNYKVHNLIFSSSATVYGKPLKVPIDESEAIKPTNPYGQTKAMIEQILLDYSISNPWFKCICLRYFNPVGSHKSGLIGEDPKGTPNNLFPYVSQVAIGKLPYLEVFGNDYDTPDGTGVRDYIHVVDLAKGHLAALRNIGKLSNYETINLGTGKGYSVLDVVKMFERASGKNIPIKVSKRRLGDISTCYADTKKALELLNWESANNIQTACLDSWNWQTKYPFGLNK